MTGLGAAGVLGVALTWPNIRERCPVGEGCAIAGVQTSALLLAAGSSLATYGATIRPDPPKRMEKSLVGPLVAGTTLFGIGYLDALVFGMRLWSNSPEDPATQRIRDRMFIPFAGPWIVAAGPDVDRLRAAFSAGVGTLQVAGGLALATAAARAGQSRRARPGKNRVSLSLVPNPQGITLTGRF